MKHGDEVKFFVGASETMATLRLSALKNSTRAKKAGFSLNCATRSSLCAVTVTFAPPITQ
jgi:hypothetical protein